MRLAQLRDQNRLTLGYTAIVRIELAVFPQCVNLVQRQMIRIQISRRVRSAVLQHFVETFLDRRQLVGLKMSPTQRCDLPLASVLPRWVRIPRSIERSTHASAAIRTTRPDISSTSSRVTHVLPFGLVPILVDKLSIDPHRFNLT